MRLLVTGGAGFIGSNFVMREILNTSKWQSITVVDSLTYAGKLSNISHLIDSGDIQFIHDSILNQSAMDRILKKTDVVVNFAAESHVDNSIKNPNVFVETNILGAHNLLSFAKLHSVSKFIQVSTDEVYGSIPEGSWTEDSLIKPNSPYSASKAGADLLALSYYKTFGLDVRITRCSNNYGPRQYPEKIIPYFLSLLAQNRKVPVYGDGSNVRDWLHVDDHCEGISKVIDLGKPGNIYNLGGGREISNLELVSYLLKYMNLDENYIEFVEDRQGHDFRYSLDWTKARRELQYYPRIDFEKGLTDTLNWYLAPENLQALLPKSPT